MENKRIKMKVSEVIKTIESQLTADEQQLLKDTINHGCWGDCDMEFRNEAGNVCLLYTSPSPRDA